MQHGTQHVGLLLLANIGSRLYANIGPEAQVPAISNNFPMAFQ